jgi:DNA-binding PadR family transcriptional regulator
MVKKTTSNTDSAEKLVQELRRGTVVLAVFSQLHQEHYGYSLRQELEERGFDINEGTLYPMLRRLETQGLLQSRWEKGDGRPRRYYSLSPQGEALFLELKAEWKYMGVVMEQLLTKNDGGSS